MKKVLSLVLALVLVLGSFSFVSAAPLNDVAGTEFESAVERLVQLGVLTGYPDGTFKPANSITRAEFATAVIKVKGYNAIAEATKGLPTGFSDVPATHWAAGHVGTASKLGLVNGMGDGTFAPEAPVTYEQAVTMVIRALGYETAALAKGGYPYGHLIVANEAKLLDTVKGVQGLAASRGIVAKLLDNALEIPLMVQVGYGTQTKWVISGTEDVAEKILLGELGFDQVSGTVTIVDAKKNSIKVGDKSLKVAAGFDFNFYEGLTINAWFKDSNMVASSVVYGAQYVPVKIQHIAKDGDVAAYDEVTIAGKPYKVAANVEVTAGDYDYAKVVLGDKDVVTFVDAHKFESLYVNKVDDGIVYDLSNYELDLEDYTVLMDGKTISVEDIEKGDILFFDDSLAVVYNNSATGEIQRVYAEGFKFGDKVKDLAEGAQYVDGKTLGKLDEAILAEMMAEKEKVEVFFNHAGDVVLVIGARGKEAGETTSYYGLVKGVYEEETVRGKVTYPVDILNNEGKVVEYSFAEATEGFGLTKEDEGSFVLVTLEDGKVADVKVLDGAKTIFKDSANDGKNKGFKLSATYAKEDGGIGYRLQQSTLIFYEVKNSAGEFEDRVVTLANAKFTGVEAGEFYVNDADRVVVVKATSLAGEPVADTETYVGLITNARTLKSGKVELTFFDGKVLLTEAAPELAEGETAAKAYENQMVSVKISKKSGDITSLKKANKLDYKVVAVEDVNISGRVINKAYELNSDAVIYDVTGTTVKTLRIRDLNSLEEDQNVRIYLDAPSDRFVNFVIVTTEEPTK